MKRDFFIQTDRIKFSKWCEDDLFLAKMLWGNQFLYVGDKIYAPTGLYHPSYELEPVSFV